ncbi:unnamed protein product [Phytomonas sp. EM1]|nr:unnamed protein product [Phytomonas sp. EM1]|eukprot:CCW62708.1 unnamed protein product [Phytomonas sp. isolate EM1]
MLSYCTIQMQISSLISNALLLFIICRELSILQLACMSKMFFFHYVVKFNYISPFLHLIDPLPPNIYIYVYIYI